MAMPTITHAAEIAAAPQIRPASASAIWAISIKLVDCNAVHFFPDERLNDLVILPNSTCASSLQTERHLNSILSLEDRPCDRTWSESSKRTEASNRTRSCCVCACADRHCQPLTFHNLRTLHKQTQKAFKSPAIANLCVHDWRRGLDLRQRRVCSTTIFKACF